MGVGQCAADYRAVARIACTALVSTLFDASDQWCDEYAYPLGSPGTTLGRRAHAVLGELVYKDCKGASGTYRLEGKVQGRECRHGNGLDSGRTAYIRGWARGATEHTRLGRRALSDFTASDQSVG